MLHIMLHISIYILYVSDPKFVLNYHTDIDYTNNMIKCEKTPKWKGKYQKGNQYYWRSNCMDGYKDCLSGEDEDPMTCTPTSMYYSNYYLIIIIFLYEKIIFF